MPHDAFIQFQTEAFRLYGEQKYAEAGAYLETNAPRFPEEASQVYNWRICVAALQGKPAQALALFAAALDSGYFWPADLLRKDADLASLQGLAEFTRLVDRSEALYRRAQAASKPELRIALPEQDGGAVDGAAPNPLLIALHGHYSNAAFHAPYWTGLTRGSWRVALPQSSQLLGYQAWGWDDTPLAMQEVAAHFSALQQQFAIDAGRTVLAGFSQGAGLAIRSALLQCVPVRRWIAIAPYLPDIAELAAQLSTRPAVPQRGFIFVGDQDPLCENLSELEGLLEERRVTVQVEVVAGIGHFYPPNFADALERALAFVLAG